MTTISGVVDPLEALVLEAPPKLMTTQETPEELPPWPRLMTSSGVVDPLEVLVPDTTGKLMTSPGTMVPVEGLPLDGGTLIGGSVGGLLNTGGPVGVPETTGGSVGGFLNTGGPVGVGGTWVEGTPPVLVGGTKLMMISVTPEL